jgi:hypothetical protein
VSNHCLDSILTTLKIAQKHDKGRRKEAHNHTWHRLADRYQRLNRLQKGHGNFSRNATRMNLCKAKAFM